MVGDDSTPTEESIARNVTDASPLPVRRRDFMKASGGMALGLFSLAGDGASVASETSGKTRVTYYTAEERQAALDNIQKYDWAREVKQNTVESAETFLSQYSLDDLWRYVGSQDIPRASWLAGGNAGYYPFSSDTWSVKYLADGATFAAKPGKQWKFTNGEYTLPTNDFEAYRESGLDDSGMFDPELADDNLLVNEEHPEMGDGWGVDDGLGWVDENGDLGPAGQRWVPVAWAHHWNVVYGYREILQPLYYAYLYTQEQKYARAASIILDRVADVYPEFSLLDTVYFDEGGYTYLNGLPNNSHGGTGRGKQVGSIFESYWVKAVLLAYDAVWPAQEGDADLVSFLNEKAETYPGLKPKRSVADIRNNIETGLLQEILPAIKGAQIRGNFGSHQTTLAMSAVIQDNPEGYTGDAIDFLFKAGGLKREDNGTPWGRWYITGGDVLASLLSKFDRDGHAYEGSVHYNSLVSSAIQGVGDVLNGYDAYEGSDLYQNVIFKQMFETQAPLTYLNTHVPHYGDTEGAGAPGFDEMIEVDNLVRAYETYDSDAVIDFIRAHDASMNSPGQVGTTAVSSDQNNETSGSGEDKASDLMGAYQAYGGDTLAQWIYTRNGQSTDGIRGGIFDPSPNDIKTEIEQIIDSEGPLDLDSSQLAGFGFTALRAGSPDNGRGVWTYYGRNAYGPDSGYGTSHTHQDTLNIGVFGYDMNLAPDLGYPEQTGDWPKRNYWTDNTISHNTVVVNARRQDKQWVSTPKHYAHTDRVQLFDVDASKVYEETDQYRRTTAQITVDDETSYAVDFFRIDGGDEHHFSFHGTTASAVTTTSLDPVQQETGTYAGPDVPKPGHGENTQYNREVGNGFNYLFNVARDDDPGEYFSVDWDVTDYWDVREDNADGVHLRLTMLTETDEVALADGKPPQRWGNPEAFRYLIARRSGNDLQTTFTSVIEPYMDSRAITDISEVPVVSHDPTARAVQIDLANGRTDYIASATNPERGHVVDNTFVFRGGFAVYSQKDGDHEHAYLHDGKLLVANGELLIHRSHGRIEGTLERFTRDLSMENELGVKITGSGNLDIGDALGEWIYIQDTAEKRNGVYEIKGVEIDRANRAILDVGERTTVKEFKDASNPDEGYVFIPREGSPFYIPLNSTWSA